MTLRLKSELFTDKKPVSITVKDYLIRKMAVKMMMSEKVIEDVVNHQFKSANEALSKNKSVEISGFGKFFFNEKKAHKMLAKFESQKELFGRWMNDETFSERKRRLAEIRFNLAVDGIKNLKPRIYEDFRDLRGMEEQPDAPQGIEENDRQHEQGEVEDL